LTSVNDDYSVGVNATDLLVLSYIFLYVFGFAFIYFF